MHTVELLVDHVTEERVAGVWRALAAAGLPSQASHGHPTNRPHLTLATSAEPPPGGWRALAPALSALPVPLRLEGVVRFGGRTRVLAWRVVPGAELTAVHRQVWELLHTDGDAHRNPLHAPGNWAPHLTLGRSRSTAACWPDELLPAQLSEPWEGTFTQARSYDTVRRTVELLS
ncbi:2'-5' RNA ligase family protein [Streptomyces kunmingensis]|uniref:2'-5' RNA ligase family protein n=1 Tax=Streptomyces kunmingensis TaxID=68225 RepID=A0ABU6C7E7_9ACTN|nr:2'-5' RNA ligase family protein [Streptomyces kunmingensis]MEB3960522.1 2'-5' RNA ligase family protein [Streptomyces kunmingensis]